MHEVYARRSGAALHLHCAACQGQTLLPDDRLEEVNEFLQAHRACPTAQPGQGTAPF